MEPFVTCQLFGQMGNQLYQVATTLAYALDYGLMPYFPDLWRKEDRISYNRERLFFRLNASKLPGPIQSVFREKIYYSADRPPPFYSGLLLSGYFQSWRHFDHHREEILKILAPSTTIEHYLKTKYSDLLENPRTVAIHVRTQNQRSHELRLHPFIGLSYYEEAIRLFPKDSLFVVFSDRINWCKHHFSKHFSNRSMVFIEGNDGVEDCFLMSKMQHQIICNSTFSWWGGYFNQNPKKQVVSPKYWRDPHFQPNFPTSDYFPKDWNLLSTTFNLPYPKDMESFQDTFQSVNG